MSHSQQLQLAVGTQNCFSTQFYTPYTNIKTSAQNAPKCIIARQKIKKNFWGGGTAPSPLGGNTPSPGPIPPLAQGASAFSFRFIYDSNTDQNAAVFELVLASDHTLLS